MRTDDEFSDLVFCPNPDHQNTRSPAFQVNLRKPLVHCFAGCGISGNYERAVAIIEGLTREDGSPDVKRARQVILRGSGVSFRGEEGSPVAKISVGRDDVGAASIDVERYRAGMFTWLPEKARAYLDGRGIDGAARSKWQLGWDEEAERVIIPAHDEKGTLRFLIRRAYRASQRPKYLYSQGFARTSLLFGACSLDRNQVASEGLILVEGSLDVIRLHQMGQRNAVAILGTGMSVKQRGIIDRIRPSRVYFLFDKDIAGAANILSAHKMLPKVPKFIVRYPPDRSDPAELKRKEVERAIEKALPISIFFQRTKVNVNKRRRDG
jgi:DNA primase